MIKVWVLMTMIGIGGEPQVSVVASEKDCVDTGRAFVSVHQRRLIPAEYTCGQMEIRTPVRNI